MSYYLTYISWGGHRVFYSGTFTWVFDKKDAMIFSSKDYILKEFHGKMPYITEIISVDELMIKDIIE